METSDSKEILIFLILLEKSTLSNETYRFIKLYFYGLTHETLVLLELFQDNNL
jgi:hypothetical protein